MEPKSIQKASRKQSNKKGQQRREKVGFGACDPSRNSRSGDAGRGQGRDANTFFAVFRHKLQTHIFYLQLSPEICTNTSPFSVFLFIRMRVFTNFFFCRCSENVYQHIGFDRIFFMIRKMCTKTSLLYRFSGNIQEYIFFVMFLHVENLKPN